jgi:hypothetical protein
MPPARFETALPARPETGRAKPRARYWRDLSAALCLKAVALALLYFLFFAPANRPTVTQQAVAGHLLGASDATMSDEVKHDR